MTPAQLGAFVAFFDLDGDNTVDCAEFLTQFFKLGLECKGAWLYMDLVGINVSSGFLCLHTYACFWHMVSGILNRPNSQANMDEYKTKLKARFAHQHVRPSSRPYTVSKHAKVVTQRKIVKRRNPATTKEEKIERRLEASTRTHCLDLSTSVAQQDPLYTCFLVIPDAVMSMTYLTELWLTNNKLTQVPGQLESLSCLRVLALDGNNLTQLCPELGQMTQVRQRVCICG